MVVAEHNNIKRLTRSLGGFGIVVCVTDDNCGHSRLNQIGVEIKYTYTFDMLVVRVLV